MSSPLRRACALSCVLLVAVAGAVFAQTGALRSSASQDELMLMRALSEVKAERLDVALSTLEELLSINPDFRLAQLVYGDLLLAKSQPLRRFGDRVNPSSARLGELRLEAQLRFSRYRDGYTQDTLPESLWQLSETQSSAIVIDVERSRLYHFENRAGKVLLLADYYVSSGKNGASKRLEGDQKTPIGVYFMTGRIPAKELPDFYGTGALPVNYPNELDLRQGRTGYGIWIHGVPQTTFSRAPRASDGCVALANADLSALWNDIRETSTPVLMARDVKWIDRAELASQAETFTSRVEQWRKDWESLDANRYARHYSKAFRSENHDYQSWGARKRRVNAGKRYIKVSLNDLSLFKYPDEENLVLTSYEQDYRSSNFDHRTRKRQYWRLEPDGVWRIVYEGTEQLRKEHLQGIPFSLRSTFSQRN